MPLLIKNVLEAASDRWSFTCWTEFDRRESQWDGVNWRSGHPRGAAGPAHFHWEEAPTQVRHGHPNTRPVKGEKRIVFSPSYRLLQYLSFICNQGNVKRGRGGEGNRKCSQWRKHTLNFQRTCWHSLLRCSLFHITQGRRCDGDGVNTSLLQIQFELFVTHFSLGHDDFSSD